MRRRLVALPFCSIALACLGCASDTEEAASPIHQDRSFTASEILGFEVASGWQGPGVLGTGGTRTEGAASLAVRPSNHAIYTSAPFALDGPPRRIRLDIARPATPPNGPGAARIFLECSDVDMHDAYVGQRDLGGLPLGAFGTIDFEVPAQLQKRLARGCSRLRVKIGLDVSGSPGTYRLDNLRILTDLLLHYRFDDASAPAVDSSGYGRHGTLAGAAELSASGRSGSALSLDGSSAYVTLPDAITDGLEEITVAAWVNMAADRAWSRIFDFGGSAGFLYFTPSIGNGQLRFSTYAGFGNEGTVLGPSLPVGVWKHVAVTSRGNDYRVYVDGVEADNQLTVPVKPADIGANALGNWIGRSRFADPLLAGRLDDFRIYDRALSAREIRSLAAPGGDYMNYRFDDSDCAASSGTIVTDASDLGRDGVLVGVGTFGSGLYQRDLTLLGDGGHVALPAGIVESCQDFTASAWVELHGNAAWNRVFDFGNADHSSFMYLTPAGFGAQGQEIHFGLVAPTGIVDMGYPFTMPLGEWSHLAVVQAGSTLTLYYNGRSVQTRTGVTVTPASMGHTLQNYFGKSQFADPAFDGALDDVRIACRAYGANEIRQLAHLPLRVSPKHQAVLGDITNVHDPSIASAAGRYYLFSTGAGLPVRTSPDLATWTSAGTVFAQNPAWVVQRFGELDSLWAPDISYFNGAYHLYYAASTFGSNHSCIGHATKADLGSASPFTDLGPVICSNEGTVDDWNAIDPHVVLDENGTPWMSLGSFWSGIKLVRLTAEGTLAESVLHDLASPPSTAIEGSYIVRRGSYHYLFASFDSCCQGANSTYKVKVGRSTKLTGPYLDRTGLDMRAGGGTLVVEGDSRWAGPGGNAVMRTTGDVWWNVYHAYDTLNGGTPTLRISELKWQDGWPVSGEP
ncbi:Arabinan endo-1,5-alpha-L-arabinosidase [Minicystis rosea]|nr:Arabinan endo-1,5-alpha-L-arabinosidase [Minicystis rosea]